MSKYLSQTHTLIRRVFWIKKNLKTKRQKRFDKSVRQQRARSVLNEEEEKKNRVCLSGRIK